MSYDPEYEYYSLEFASEIAYKHLLASREKTLWHLYAYYFGDSFRHFEAYQLCSVANMWPEFCLNPDEPSEVMVETELMSSDAQGTEHQEFEAWVDANRKALCLAAAAALGIAWEEVVALTPR